MKSALIIVAALAGLWAAPALARDGQLQVAGNAYRVPLPDGYCDSGPGVDRFLKEQGSNPEMVLVRCGKDAASDYYIAKVSATARPVSRDAYLADMIRTMPDKPTGTEAVTDDGITPAARRRVARSGLAQERVPGDRGRRCLRLFVYHARGRWGGEG